MIRHPIPLAVAIAKPAPATTSAGPPIGAAAADEPVAGATCTPTITGPWTTLFSPTQPAPAGYLNDHTVIRGSDAGPALTLSGGAVTVPWGSVESPFVFQYGSSYYLSVTITDSDKPSYHDTYIFRAATPTDFGDFDGTSATGAGQVMTKLPVHAPEYVVDTDGQWYITTAGWRNYSLYPEAATGVAIAPLTFVNDQ